MSTICATPEKNSVFGASKINDMRVGGSKKYGIDEFFIIKKMLTKNKANNIL